MEAGKTFYKSELENFLYTFAHEPPPGAQWWEFPRDGVPAIVVDDNSITATLVVLDSKEEFEDRPMGARLVVIPRNMIGVEPARKPAKPRQAVPASKPRKEYRRYWD